MDKVTIYNAALSLLGQNGYREGSGNAAACELWYPHALAAANARYNWTFATRRKTLHPLEGESQGNESVFEYPADCINYTHVRNNDTGDRAADPRRIGNRLVTEPCSSVTLTYNANCLATMQELPDTMPEFTLGVIELLAARIAPEVTGNPAYAVEYENRAEQHFMQAITRDAQQLASNKRDPWLNIRESNIFRKN